MSGYSSEMYQIIESDFIEFTNYVPLEEGLLDNVYSPRLADIIIRLGCQIEAFFKEWLNCPLADSYPKVDSYRNGFLKMHQFKKFFEPTAKLSSQEVLVIKLGYTIRPFEDFIKSGDDVPFWWTIYNDQKHKAYIERKKATIRNTLYPLAALFVLNGLIPNERDIIHFGKHGFSYPQYKQYESPLFVYKPAHTMLDFTCEL